MPLESSSAHRQRQQVAAGSGKGRDPVRAGDPDGAQDHRLPCGITLEEQKPLADKRYLAPVVQEKQRLMLLVVPRWPGYHLYACAPQPYARKHKKKSKPAGSAADRRRSPPTFGIYPLMAQTSRRAA